MRYPARSVLLFFLLSAPVALASKKPVDEAGALKIADRVLCQVYGKKHIDAERPLKAELVGSTWRIHGTIHELTLGGVAQIWIDQKSGRVVKIEHPK